MANILIFDSGVGGLSIFQEVQLRLPSHHYIYCFDNQAYPYGELDASVLVSRVNLFIQQVASKHSIDMIIIACNTASTIVLPSLRQSFSIPVVGVVPAIKPATYLAKKAIGLIATPATIQREYTHQLIDKYAENIPIELLGSTDLVKMGEDKLRGKTIDLLDLRKILSPLINKIDIAVLGCTHFPLLRDEIGYILGAKVKLIDSGKAIAKRVESLLGNEEEKLSWFDWRLKKEKVYPIYSSAPAWEADALNISLNELGFMPIQILPLQGV